MIKTIKILAVILICYCIIRLSSGDYTVTEKEYGCFFGDETSIVYPVMAHNQQEAEDKMIDLEPDHNYETYCRVRKSGE